MHEKLESKKMPYILEVNEITLVLNENEKAFIMEKAHKSFEDLVLKQLHEHCYPFLGIHGRKNQHPFPGLKSQSGV